MPARAALNVVYSMITEHMDAKERTTFDDELYGFAELNRAATKRLHDMREEEN